MSILPTYSLSEVSTLLKQTIEEMFHGLRIKGEISGLKIASSGHIYFTLKDHSAILNAVCWKYTAIKFAGQLDDGLEVICSGNISIYQGRSYYQLIVEKVEISGEGTLFALFQKRKEKLQHLFADIYKKPLPFLPKTIGIITSLQGSVIQDIIHRVRERFPLHIMIWNVHVQGTEAASEIAEAIHGFNKIIRNKPDLIIVARGGGSIEDLWAFNEEIVIEAAFASIIPIISAIGHETDFTLLDFVSDKRAPTPTAAAEIATPVLEDLLSRINALKQTSELSLKNTVQYKKARINQVKIALEQNKLKFFQKREYELALFQRIHDNINSYLNIKYHSLDIFKTKLTSMIPSISKECSIKKVEVKGILYKINSTITQNIKSHKNKMLLLSKLLKSYDTKNILKRGFARIRDQNNEFINSKIQLYLNKNIVIEMHDCQITAIIDKISSN